MSPSSLETYRVDHEPVYGLQAWVNITPAFDCIIGDCRVEGCSDNHGRGTERHRYVLAGEGLATQFVYHTATWHSSTPLWVKENAADLYPFASDLGYHAATPQYEGQSQYEHCDILGIDCYYDGSGLNAEPVLERFLAEGESAIWEELHLYWREKMDQIMQRARVGS